MTQNARKNKQVSLQPVDTVNTSERVENRVAHNNVAVCIGPSTMDKILNLDFGKYIISMETDATRAQNRPATAESRGHDQQPVLRHQKNTYRRVVMSVVIYSNRKFIFSMIKLYTGTYYTTG